MVTDFATDFDVIIVGAGISGIGAAVHLRQRCPQHSFAILESRPVIGGTWDLFRYPGIRSDSDMYTLGFDFKPWTHPRAIADGPAILDYLAETVREHELQRHIRFGHRVSSAVWDSATARWTLTVLHEGREQTLSCNFLYMCSGYYRYDRGYTPNFAGCEHFTGTLVHPQHWPEALDTRDKQVVVIGSGATAMTLVPTLAHTLADTAGHVTMLQRSPTYVISRPAEDRLANRLRRWLPAKLAYSLIRWRNVLLQWLIFQIARARPEKFGNYLIDQVRRQVPSDYDVDTHFTPRYKPWDQRLCLVPDGDLFAALRSGRASIVTDVIERFTEHGIRLISGRELPADIVVTATGLELQFLGGMSVIVDGRKIDFSTTFGYKGLMCSGVPNLACAFGYTNASWTLKADLTSDYVCRLLNYMRTTGQRVATAVQDDPAMPAESWIDFTSGYIQRGLGAFPRQGSRPPWRLHQNYLRDLLLLRFSRVNDGVLRFSNPPAMPT